jgi:hypothetical protein
MDEVRVPSRATFPSATRNRNHPLLFLVALLSVFGFLRDGFAQEAGLSREETQPPSKYSLSPFEISSERLAPDYCGHDPEVLYVRLLDLSADRKKGEFETTAEYDQRIAKMTVTPVLGTLNYGSIYAFCVDNSEIKSLYDPDKGILVVDIRFWSVYGEPDWKSHPPGHRPTQTALISKSKYRDEGKYVGTNAFGASAVVDAGSSVEYGIVFSNLDLFPVEKTAASTHFSVGLPIGPTAARAAKGSLRALAVCRLVSPYVKSTSGGIQPTLEQPTSFLRLSYYLETELLELWFYDMSSGVVVAKIEPSDDCDHRPEQSKCRRGYAQVLQTEMKKKDPRVTVTVVDADDTAIIFTSQALLKNKEARTSFRYDEILSGVDKFLCVYGFRRLVLAGSAQSTKVSRNRSEYDLNCGDYKK